MKFPVESSKEWQENYNKRFASINNLLNIESDVNSAYYKFLYLTFHKRAHDCFVDWWCDPLYRKYKEDINVADDLARAWFNVNYKDGLFRFYATDAAGEEANSKPPFFIDTYGNCLNTEEEIHQFLTEHFPYVVADSGVSALISRMRERVLEHAKSKQDEQRILRAEKSLEQSRKNKYREVTLDEWLNLWERYRVYGPQYNQTSGTKQ